jgi:hypothetical protein
MEHPVASDATHLRIIIVNPVEAKMGFVVFNHSVAKNAQPVTITKIKWLMLFNKIKQSHYTP